MQFQNKAIKPIHKVKYNPHTKPLMRESGLLDLTDIFDLRYAKFNCAFKHGNLSHTSKNMCIL